MQLDLVQRPDYECLRKVPRQFHKAESRVIRPFLPAVFLWVSTLIVKWLVLFNLGVGLFNLLPLGPLDGGRMFLTAATTIFKNEKKAKLIFTIVSILGLILIIINLLPFLIKSLQFFITPILTLFG